MLVNPLMPTYIRELIGSQFHADELNRIVDLAAIFPEDANKWFTVRNAANKAVVSIRSSAALDEKSKQEKNRQELAALLLASLGSIALHDAVFARECFRESLKLSKAVPKNDRAERTRILESLGLVRSLLEELEERLGSYKNCMSPYFYPGH